MQSYPNISHSPDNRREKSTKQNQSSNLYTQTYQCTCSQIFKTLNDYQRHIIDEKHQQILTKPNVYQHSGHNIIVQKHQKQSQTLKKSKQINLLYRPSQNGNNAQLSNNQVSNHQAKTSYFKNYLRPEQILVPERIQNIHNQVSGLNFKQKDNQTRMQEKQVSFKYIEAYYRSKLDPFYRQLDINPEKSLNSQRPSSYQQNTYQSEQMKRRKQNKISQITRQDSTKNVNKILEQLQVRMIPVQNGIIDFLGNFIKENNQRLSKVTEEQVESIYRNFQTSLIELNMMCDINRYNRLKRSQEFMDSDLDLVIGMFIEFLKQILRPNEIWIAHSMLLIVVEGIKKFLLINQNQLRENLKISDVPLLFNAIKSHSQTLQNEASFTVGSQTSCQILVWFCQWSTMVQYVKNKWNLDFIEPLLYNVHQINYLYQENVIAYQKCTESKRRSFARIAKRKHIQKQKNRRNQLQFLQKHRKKYFKDINYFMAGDFNIQAGNQKERQPANRLTHGTTIQNYPTNYNHIQSYLYENHRRQDIAVNKVAQKTQNLRAFPESSQMNNLYRGSYIPLHKSKQRVHDKSQEGEVVHHSHQVNQEENQKVNSIDDIDSKSLYLPIYQSQFVSYFSPQAEELRKKQKQIWNIKLQKLKQIIANPILWKQTMKQEIPRQLQQVEQLTNQLQVDLIMINLYKKDLVKNNRSHFLPNDIHLGTNLNHNFISVPSESERQNSRINTELQDPFIIKRNFRQRKHNSSLINSANSQKIQNKLITEEKHERNDRRLNEESERPLSNDSLGDFF